MIWGTTIFGNFHILQLEMDVFSCFFLVQQFHISKNNPGHGFRFLSLVTRKSPQKKNNCYIKKVPVTLQDQRFAVNQSKTGDNGDKSWGLTFRNRSFDRAEDNTQKNKNLCIRLFVRHKYQSPSGPTVLDVSRFTLRWFIKFEMNSV